MKQYYGFYPGIIVNTDDPENRGRVQVFVPEISTTLYADWNADDVDISFTTASFSEQVLDRLKSLLPWAEIAVSFWGGSTSAPQNETSGSPAPAPSEDSASAENKDKPEEAQVSPVDAPKNNGANNPEGKFDNSKGVNINPNGKTAILAIGTNDSDAGYSQTKIKTNTIDLINSLRKKGYQVYVIPPNPNKYGSASAAVSDAASGIAQVINLKDANLAKTYTGDGVHLSPSAFQYVASTYKPNIVVGDSNAQIFSDYNLVPLSNNYGISGQRSDQVLKRIDQVPNSGDAPNTSEVPQEQRVIRPTELVNDNGPVDVGGRPGAPVGAVSTPIMNSKVIVFFHNGNPNFPICLCGINDCITAVP